MVVVFSSVHNNIDVSNYFPQVFNWFLKNEILKKKPKNGASIFNAITVIFEIVALIFQCYSSYLSTVLSKVRSTSLS